MNQRKLGLIKKLTIGSRQYLTRGHDYYTWSLNILEENKEYIEKTKSKAVLEICFWGKTYKLEPQKNIFDEPRYVVTNSGSAWD